ncbi:lytic transglycosylase domain-containing protein [Roseomonas eburnea]|uniref:Lytic transglycosylase domain-containing protein n=1 Tax=Neoroseomonas eburnea TaxID=1346889 RepID=A0A9X9XJ69_9PROT|nr:lytic transglycosylase domain-containing protein [Neoroseomonas eburnea]MBR0683755.1 lytic transglycosylase domain-containing protein [Neoroseomonas eburnea]
MRRLLLLAALLAPLPAAAQPWAPDGARAAGRQALSAAASQRWGEAESFAAAADPLAAKIVLWMRLSNRIAPASAAELVSFLAENPDWPLPDTMTRRAEAALAAEPDDSLALRHFSRNPARTLGGALRHAEALDRAGRAQDARAVVRHGWVETPGDAFAEEAMLLRFGSLLTEEEHWRRFDRLAFARDIGGAGRAAQRLTGARRASADTRLALARDDDSALAARPADIGWAYEAARLLRRRERDQEAAAAWAAAEPLQRDLSADAARAVWAERQVLSRKLLRLGMEREAYRTAAAHGQAMAGEPRQEGEFLAGFIALRRLNDPPTAERHFAALGQDSRSVITRARSAYWQGRALAARGDAGGARGRYAAAAELPVAFYGQLGALALGENEAQLSARVARSAVPAVTPPRAVDFTGRELARAVLTLADLGDTRRARIFLLRLEELANDGTDRLLTARLANHIGRPDHAVWIARRAGADGDILLPEGWPAPYRPPVTNPEPAFINAITRQESNFDTEAVSGANARGLMQLLPSTATLVARRLGVPFQPVQLTTSPEVNMRLGAGYLEQMLDRYDGALPLAAAAYNAGPGRVDQWLGTYGDPRGPGVDMIDWMEQIPFSETRNYVQRVIENVVVYRAQDPGAAAREHPLARYLRTTP